ncbi:MAG: TonB-dependent receptor [Thermodesulfobacteria bacterium]|nr:TonB-dependent receptor [Thermodesulfobacteriota bacterium]
MDYLKKPLSNILLIQPALLCLIVLAWVPVSYANTTSALPFYEPERIYYFMDEPVITASRFSQPTSQAPSTVMVITSKIIQERGYKNLVDVLEDLPGFDIQKHIGGQAGGTYVIQRGLWGNNKLLVLKDGIRLNPENGSNLVYGNQLSLGDLKQIEVMYGPASAIYGADAYAGIINLITKKVDTPKNLELEVSGGNADTAEGHILFQARPTYDSFLHIYAHGYSSNGFNLRDLYKDYHYHHPLYGRTYFYAPDQSFEIPERDWDMAFKAGWKSLEVEAVYLHTSQPTNIAAPYNTGRTQHAKDRVILDTWSFRLKHDLQITDYLEAVTKFKGQIYRMDPESRYGRRQFNNYIYERSDMLGMEEQLRYSYQSGKILGGFVFKRISTMPYLNSRTPFDEGDTYNDFPIKEVITSDGEHIEIGPFKEQHYWTYGVYVQANHRVTSKVSLFAGARLDWETFTHHKSFNPRTGIIYTIKRGETLKLMYGHAYISPSAYFRFKAWVDNNYAHLPPSVFGYHLKPEKVSSVELSYSKHTERLFLNMSAYVSRSTDSIQEAGRFLDNVLFVTSEGIQEATVEITDNTGRQTNFGIDLAASYRLSRFATINFGYSFINARQRLRGHSFDAPKISNHKFLAGITGYVGKHFSYNVRCRWISEIHTSPTNTVYHGTTIPGIFLIDANIRWLNLLPGLDAHLTIKNLLDSKYFTAANGSGDPTNGASLPRVPQDPLSFLMGLSYRF